MYWTRLGEKTVYKRVQTQIREIALQSFLGFIVSDNKI